MKTRSRNTHSLHFVFLKRNTVIPPANVGEAFTDKPFLSFYKHLIILHLCSRHLFTLSCYSFTILLGNKCHLEMAFWLKYQLKHEIRFYEHLLLIPQLEC